MSKWPGKYVIGLTGNIATGKSVVRKMLEHLGAYSIDADALSHRAIAKGAPGYKAVLDFFGKWLVTPDGEIDRSKLSHLAFDDPSVMASLEGIIHPLVSQAVDLLVSRSKHQVIVIEAIKLLESDLRAACDTIWVVDVPGEVQVERLMQKRGFSRDDAQRRVFFQGSPLQKIKAAQVVIQNNGSFEETWKQVAAAWKKYTPQAATAQAESSAGAVSAESAKTDSIPTSAVPQVTAQVDAGHITGPLVVKRGRPRDSSAIAELVTRLSGGLHKMTHHDVMVAFGEKAFLLLQAGDKNVGVAGWQVENLVATTTEFYIDPAVELAKGLSTLIKEVERASLDLQCEASILFLPDTLAQMQATWKQLGYEPRSAKTLGVQAWTDAAQESAHPNTQLFFKQLRMDRVVRPI